MRSIQACLILATLAVLLLGPTGLAAQTGPPVAVWTNDADTRHLRIIHMQVSQDRQVIRVQVNRDYARDASETCTNPNHVDIRIEPDSIHDEELQERRELELFRQMIASVRNALLGYRQVDFKVLVGQCSMDHPGGPTYPIAIGVRIHSG